MNLICLIFAVSKATVKDNGMRFLRNPNFTIAVLAIYTAAIYLYFFPRNHEMSTASKAATVGASVVILAFLWFLLRRRERLRRERENDIRHIDRKEE